MQRRFLALIGTIAIVAAACSTTSNDTLSSDDALTTNDIDAAIEAWEPTVADMMAETGIPGVAVAIVFEGQVVYSAGFGVREVDGDEPIDTDTVFQIASVSKPIASTVVAGLVGDGAIAWSDPIVEYDPGFRLSDELATQQVSFIDLFSHRSGLPDHAGDLLEDIGYSREEIFDRLRYLPLTPIRAEYAYTNYGLTKAAVVAAEATGSTWEAASDEILYTPAGMVNTSSSFADYLAADNRAVPHVMDGDGWAALYQRDPDPQSPAGGVSSTVDDLARWMRLQLANGSLDGVQIIDPDALAETKIPYSLRSPPGEPGQPAPFYGLGWNVNQGDQGVSWSHSGAFILGTGTNVQLDPGHQLGIVTLTNGEPIGLAESISSTFMDLALHGESPDWLERYQPAFKEIMRPDPQFDYTTPLANATAPGDPAIYEGVYANDYFGDLTVTATGGSLTMLLGPDDMGFPLNPYDGDTFWYQPTGENGVNPSAVTFAVSDATATSVTVEFLDDYGLGTFVRP